MLVLDADLRVQHVNAWLAAHASLPRAAHVPAAMEKLFPDLPAGTRAALETVARERQPRLLSAAIHHPIFPLPGAGPGGLMRQIVRLVPLESGPGIVALIEDVSDQLAYEEQLEQSVAERTRALAASEARLRSLLQTMGEAVIATNLQGQVTDWNEAAQRIYGWSAEEALGQVVTDLLATQYDDPDETRASALAAVRRHGLWRGTVLQRTKNGALLNIAATVSAQRGADGQPAGLVAINRDITESRRREATIQRLEQVNRAISAGLTLNDIFSTFVAQIRGVLPFDRAALALFDADRQSYAEQAVFRRGRTDLRAGEARPLAGSLLSIVRITLEPLTVPDIREREFDARLQLEAEGVRALLLLPLAIGGESIGALSFGSRQAGAYGPPEAHLLASAAEQMAIALHTARLLDGTTRRVVQLTALYEAGIAFSRMLNPDELAQEAIRILESLLNFDYLAVLLVEPSTGMLLPFAISDLGQGQTFAKADLEYLRGFGLRVGLGVTGWVAEHGQPVRLDAAAQDARYLTVRTDIVSELCVPLKVGDRVVGVINTETRTPKAYSADDERLLVALAGPLAVAIENTRLYAQARQTQTQLRDLSLRLVRTQESERAQLARELHDEVGQTLTALKLNLQSGLAEAPPHLSELLSDSLALGSRLLDQVRALSLDLRPSLLDDLGLAPALRWYLDRTAQRVELDIHLDAPNDLGRLPTDLETVFFRVAQEAVTNVVRHAQAKNLWVQVARRDQAVELHVTDDGVGFGFPSAGFAAFGVESLGLRSMNERATLAGAQLEVDTALGRGTRISLRAPAPAGAA